MADRTDPAGGRVEKREKIRKRPLPGTSARALDGAAGVKTAGRAVPGDRYGRESGKRHAAAFREKRSGIYPSAPSGKRRAWKTSRLREEKGHGNLCHRGTAGTEGNMHPAERKSACGEWNNATGMMNFPCRNPCRTGKNGRPESLRHGRSGAVETRASVPSGSSRPSRGGAPGGTDMP